MREVSCETGEMDLYVVVGQGEAGELAVRLAQQLAEGSRAAVRDDVVRQVELCECRVVEQVRHEHTQLLISHLTTYTHR